ncbi:exported hypothetical protein [Verrucomicrobia bacterium]|nr:exported hypothetical protein [Verrucomicrobiota bacterium]
MQGGSAMQTWRRVATVLALTSATFGSAVSGADTPELSAAVQNESGPTLRLDFGSGESSSNAVAAFMYFVPLISPVPVTAVTSPGSTQQTRLTSATRQQSARSFTTTCDFEFTGDGSQRDIFDLAQEIQRHERQLKAGGTLGRQLQSITVTGPGRGRIEVKGTITNGVQTVTQVRLRFNAQGQTSPVSIGLCDVRYLEGGFQQVNENVARVNTLTFRREPGQPRMEITVASVKRKGASNGLWQNFKGSLTGAAVNLLIDPLPVEVIGNHAMLEFGQALVAGAGSFTFPHARHLLEQR